MPREVNISLSRFMADAAVWIARAQSGRPIVLVHDGDRRAVVQNYEDYRRNRVEVALLARSNQALVADAAGERHAHGDVVARARARLIRR